MLVNVHYLVKKEGGSRKVSQEGRQERGEGHEQGREVKKEGRKARK